MIREHRHVIICLLALAALGAWQHLYFSYSVREFAFFKNAYDEDTYILLPFGTAGVRLDRVLSGSVVSMLLWLSNGSYTFVLLAMDTILPPLMFLAAYFAGSALFANVYARILFALAVIFATDIFSLGSTASYPGPFPTLDQLKALVGARFVPPFETSYLSIYRSPEPQVSYVVAFTFVGLILRTVLRQGDELRRRDIACLTAVQVLLMACYSLISYPMILVEAWAALCLFVEGRRRNSLVLATLFVASAAAAIVAARITLGPNSSAVFHSNLPTITVGVLTALATFLILVSLLLWHRKADWRLLLGLAFSGVPLLVTNQQLLTGTMVSSRDWERYTDFPFVALAIGVLISYLNWKPRGQKWIAGGAAIAISVFVFASSERTYRDWLPDNLKSLAIARAIRAAGASLASDTVLVLDEPQRAPWVRTRLDRPVNMLLDYTETFKNPIPSTTEFKLTAHSNALFEFWRQTGVNPETARDILQQEIRDRGGYYSGFIFSTCEYWSPCTDGRAVKTEKFVAALPSVIASYDDFLKQPASRKFALVVSLPQSKLNAGRQIGEGHALSETARVLLRD